MAIQVESDHSQIVLKPIQYRNEHGQLADLMHCPTNSIWKIDDSPSGLHVW